MVAAGSIRTVRCHPPAQRFSGQQAEAGQQVLIHRGSESLIQRCARCLLAAGDGASTKVLLHSNRLSFGFVTQRAIIPESLECAALGLPNAGHERLLTWPQFARSSAVTRSSTHTAINDTPTSGNAYRQGQHDQHAGFPGRQRRGAAAVRPGGLVGDASTRSPGRSRN
jgi:hypothetical protein